MNNMILHFMYHRDPKTKLRVFMLVQLKALFQPIEVGTPSCTVLETWPCNKYSREKALNRSDNIVGKLVRRAEPSTEFTYTQETPTI